MQRRTAQEPSTIAGHPFSVECAGAGGGTRWTGGMLSLRISLRDAPLIDLARALAKLEGVRVTAGPAIVSRGDCYLVHCPGFKLVLSATVPGSDFAQGLLSRAMEPTLTLACELGQLFARLMSAPTPRPAAAGSEPGKPEPADRTDRRNRMERVDAPSWTGMSTLRRTALQPGKTLSRKTPLARKTPLGRGKRLRP